ncbi:Lnb N-terminal periplasmic domain-containing protein [Grimontia kaedaensis]|uniref:Lnb N-terminal periplasmic domain-containing protein n=1 Tax=Grimontia kaedaensis TaxID=2872157 RepID=UPI002072FE66|nr:DUF4105 domain-containing protein [Grimontia kaedaensis]
MSFFLLQLLVSFTTNAGSTHQEALSTNLHNDLTWLSLLHHEPSWFGSESLINSPDFFLSQNGKIDAASELIATLEAFKSQPQSQCRFPARKIWLEQQLPNARFPEVDCTNYQAYRRAFKAESVSLVYASGYLGNPASMYGHLLLKFNSKNNHEFLDNTFNYGARVPDGDNKFVYIYKGITGGYSGHFTNQKYHHQNLTYNESELRDLWEYRLDLPQEKVNFLLAHLWELEHSSMTYYFFAENCAYQLAKVLEMVIEKPLVAKGKSWVMPYDIVMMLNKPDTSEVVEKVTYHGSRQEQLYERFTQLSREERDTVARVISEPSTDLAKHFNKHSNDEVTRIIDTLYDYYAFIDVKNNGLSEPQTSKLKALLALRFSLPASETRWKAVEKIPPHKAQNTTMFQASTLYNEAFGEAMALRFRANYYDLLSVNAARIPNSALNTFDLTFLYTKEESKVRLREFTLIDIINLNLSQTGLPGDSQWAWGISAGYKPTSLNCIDCSDTTFEGFAGTSWRPFDGLVSHLALAGELQVNSLKDINFLSGPEVGGILTVTPYWVTSIKLGGYFNLDEKWRYENHLTWEQRFFEHQAFDVRTSVRYNQGFEYAAHLSIYW